MKSGELGFEEKFHNTNCSANRGTISYSKSNSKKFKLCVTPTPQSKDYETFSPPDGEEISGIERTFSSKTEKSKSLRNVYEMNSKKDVRTKTTSGTSNYLSVFNENYEDLVSTIQNTSHSSENFLRQSAPFGKSQYFTTKETQSKSTFKSSIIEATEKIKSNCDPISILLSQVDDDEIKGLTNTEDISNFYEYTEDCMKRILKLVVTPIEELTDMMITLPFSDMINAGAKRLAIFDLDETLVHCQLKNPKEAQQTIPVRLPSKVIAQVGVNIRPHWKEALDEIKKDYFIIVYTASHQSYADSVLDYLDPDKKYFEYRLYRNNCVRVKIENENEFIYVKDLRIFKNINLKDVIIIDNSVLSFAFQLENGIPIMPYYDSKEDVELVFLAYFLKAVAGSSDLRVENQAKIRLEHFLQQAKEEADEDEDEVEDEDIELKSHEYEQPKSKSNLTLNLLPANEDDKEKQLTVAKSKSEQKTIRPRLRRQSTLQSDLKNILLDLKKHFTEQYDQ